MDQTAEFMLAAACCRWPRSPARDAAIRAVAASVDWERFLLIARRHRIEGLAHDGLRAAAIQLPAETAATLAARAGHVARRGLANAAEEARILDAMEAAGLPLLFVKGTTLAMLAYGSLALKSAWDIDMLVAPKDLDAACQGLTGLGYHRVHPAADLPPAYFRRWTAHSKESIWFNPARETHVELHTALLDNRHLLPGVGIMSPSERVRIADGVALPTLTRDRLFAYLCVHGTSHAWSRLKWLADIAALIGHDAGEAERLHRAAVALGAGRCSGVALLLCGRLFEIPLSAGLAAELRADRGTCRLERTALWALASAPDGAREFGDRAAEALRYLAAHFLLSSGWRYRLAELRHKSLFPYSPTHLAMPSWFRLPYSVARLPFWVWANRRGRIAPVQDSPPNMASSP